MADGVAEIAEKLLTRPLVTLSAWDDVNAPMVRQWCEVMGNRNPRYARGGEIPAAMLHVWTMPGFGGAFPEGAPVDLVREASVQFSALGFTGVMAVRIQQQYIRSLVLGERLHREILIESVSPVKRTAVGDGIFVVEIATIFSGTEKIGTTRLTLLCFRPHDAHDGGAKHAQIQSGSAVDTLRLTAHFVISAAIATRDFEDVHLQPAGARARGMKDVYINIMTSLGLAQRWIEGDHGENIVISDMDLHLLAPAYPGDELGFTSQRSSPGQSVEFAMQLRQSLHARGVAQILTSEPNRSR